MDRDLPMPIHGHTDITPNRSVEPPKQAHTSSVWASSVSTRLEHFAFPLPESWCRLRTHTRRYRSQTSRARPVCSDAGHARLSLLERERQSGVSPVSLFRERAQRRSFVADHSIGFDGRHLCLTCASCSAASRAASTVSRECSRKRCFPRKASRSSQSYNQKVSSERSISCKLTKALPGLGFGDTPGKTSRTHRGETACQSARA